MWTSLSAPLEQRTNLLHNLFVNIITFLDTWQSGSAHQCDVLSIF